MAFSSQSDSKMFFGKKKVTKCDKSFPFQGLIPSTLDRCMPNNFLPSTRFPFSSQKEKKSKDQWNEEERKEDNFRNLTFDSLSPILLYLNDY